LGKSTEINVFNRLTKHEYTISWLLYVIP